MKKRITIAITLVLAVGALAAAPLVLAGGRHGHFGGHGFGPLGHLAHVKGELDLTDEQAAQLKTIFAETRAASAQHRQQLHGGYMGVAKALLANPNDVAGAQALIDQQLNAERALKANFLEAAAKASAVLNAEQRAKLATLIDEHAEHRGRRGR